MNLAVLTNDPFIKVALPIMVTILVAVWAGVYSSNKRLDDIIDRLKRIEEGMADHGTRIIRLEERLPLIHR